MDIEQVSKEVLKDLVLQYQQDQSPETFGRILEKVDKLILYEIHRLRRKCPHLRQEDTQDLYQTAIVGLYTAISYVTEQDSPDIVLAKLVVYLKAEIKKNFPQANVTFETLKAAEVVEAKDTLFHNLQYNEILEILKQLVISGIVTQKELDLIRMRFAEGLTYRKIAEKNGLYESTVRLKIQKILDRIRHQLRVKGIKDMFDKE